jgi:hypothetical protein
MNNKKIKVKAARRLNKHTAYMSYRAKKKVFRYQRIDQANIAEE